MSAPQVTDAPARPQPGQLSTPARPPRTLTLAIGQICFFIPVALIAKPIPGKEPHYS